MSKRVSSSSSKTKQSHASSNRQSTLKLKSSDVMSDNEDPIVNNTDDDEQDEVEAESKARSKKATKKEEVETVAEVASSSVAASAPAPAPIPTVVADAAAAAEPEIYEEKPDGEEIYDPGYNVMTKIASEAARLTPAIAKRKTVLVRNPDLAMILWCRSGKKNISWLDFNTREEANKKILFVWQQEDKAKRKKEHTNVKAKRIPQSFAPTIRHPLMSLSMITPAGRTSFLKHGYTKENGVNGNLGADMGKGVIVTEAKMRYTFELNNESYSPLIADAENMNPVMTAFLEGSKHFEKAVLAAAFNTTGAKKAKCMQEIEEVWAAKAEKDDRFVVPKTIDAKVEAAMALFETKIGPSTQNKEDPGVAISFGTSAFRSLWSDWQTKEQENPEAEGYVAPSDAFLLVPVNELTQKRQIHNDIPVFACRRAQDVQEGVKYDAPYFLIPKENAELDFHRDVVFVLHSKGFYPWKLNKAGCTNKQIAYIWLNTKAALMNMTSEEIVACDPLKAIPMAGVYEGPLDRQRKEAAKATMSADGNTVDFMSNV
jgi:hypothetical protein